MRTALIQIGNSRGIRLPKAIIEQAGLNGELELEVVNRAVIIRATDVARRGWREAAAECRQAEVDPLGDWDVLTGEHWDASK